MKVSIILLLIGCTANLFSQDITAFEILSKSAGTLKKIQHLTYTANYRIKYFDNKDTTKRMDFNVSLVKAPQDTILGYFATVQNDQTARAYDGYEFILVTHFAKKVTKDTPHQTGMSFTRNNILREYIPVFLYSSSPLSRYLTEAKNLTARKVLWKSGEYWRIEFQMPTDEEITLRKVVLLIDQNSYLPVRMETYAKFENIQDEYTELNISYRSIDLKPSNELPEPFQLPTGYEQVVYKAPNIDYTLLSLGSSMIPIRGTDLNSNSLTLEPLPQNNLMLIDFWFLGCGPCLKAMPHLAELAKKFKSKGLLVYGLNPIDPISKAEQIKLFATKYQVEYPLLFISKIVAKDYKVNVYPTFYLIKDGKILYANYSYNEKSFRELEDIISSTLAK